METDSHREPHRVLVMSHTSFSGTHCAWVGPGAETLRSELTQSLSPGSFPSAPGCATSAHTPRLRFALTTQEQAQAEAADLGVPRVMCVDSSVP